MIRSLLVGYDLNIVPDLVLTILDLIQIRFAFPHMPSQLGRVIPEEQKEKVLRAVYPPPKLSVHKKLSHHKKLIIVKEVIIEKEVISCGDV